MKYAKEVEAQTFKSIEELLAKRKVIEKIEDAINNASAKGEFECKVDLDIEDNECDIIKEYLSRLDYFVVKLDGSKYSDIVPGPGPIKIRGPLFTIKW